ncbi:unnamed protein product [Clonostachys rosea f. rosea IK726]|uniref:Uncharacterized protein n=2 Tax=Bionectria ochroleuca TaxID=29856 RepID=A0ACA9UFS0_BIOOC|nr:unnamed protein product [Clonostachys rosea f. rosea IK726]
MVNTGAAITPAASVTQFDDLHFDPEGQVIINMVTKNDVSAASAVDEIVTLSSTTAASSADNALYRHGSNVSLTIHALSKRIPHSQQSKLVEFCIRLQQVTVPGPTNGGVLEYKGQVFWSQMPQMSITLAEYQLTRAPTGSNEDASYSYKNFTAWRAQLSELGFCHYKEDISWNYDHPTRVFQQNYKPTRKREDVRLMCMWFIYAPQKVWLDFQLRRKRKNSYLHTTEEFQSWFWPSWKDYLEDCQKVPSEDSEDEDMLSDGSHNEDGNNDAEDFGVEDGQDVSDQDTQELIGRALNNIEEVEIEQGMY